MTPTRNRGPTNAIDGSGGGCGTVPSDAMNLLCWNCRGSDMTVGELHWLVKTYQPSLLFLSEMTMWVNKAKNFIWSLGYSGSFVVCCKGLSGGLALSLLAPYFVMLR